MKGDVEKTLRADHYGFAEPAALPGLFPGAEMQHRPDTVTLVMASGCALPFRWWESLVAALTCCSPLDACKQCQF